MVIPDCFSLAAKTASWTLSPYMPFPPYLGKSDGWMFTILFSYSYTMASGIFFKKPARTTKPMPLSRNNDKTVPSSNCLPSNTTAGTFKFYALCKTYATGLLHKIKLTSAVPLAAKYLHIFSAFDPLPDAKTAIFILSIFQTNHKQSLSNPRFSSWICRSSRLFL